MLDSILCLRVDDLANTLNRVRLPKHPPSTDDDLDQVGEEVEGMVQLEALALPAGFWRYVQSELQMQAENLYHNAIDLRDALATTSDDVSEDEKATRLRKAWETFHDLRNAANDISADFIELVAGLAFRERSRDWWVFRAADSIVTECANVLARQNWDPVTVPGLKHAVAQTLKQVVRLRFPDWSIWALPITAHEFWRVYLPSNANQPRAAVEWSMNLCRGLGADDATLHQLLADAFATCTMGPSYASAALLLKLSVEEADRAHVILKSLELAGGSTDDRAGEYDKQIVEPIRAWWAASPGTHDVDPDRAARLDDVAGIAYGALDRFFVGARYLDARWSANVVPVGDALKKGRDIPHKDSLTQRDILNAIWMARLTRNGNDATNDVIAAGGQQLFKDLLDRQQPPSKPVLQTPAQAQR